MQIIAPAKVHPVIIIGSGASGGMAAWNLTSKGIDVVMLDAGEKFDRTKYDAIGESDRMTLRFVKPKA